MTGEKSKKNTLSGVIAVQNIFSTQAPVFESIKSVLNFVDELIIVDGGSTDNTVDCLEELDPKIKVVYLEWPENFDWSQYGRSYAFGIHHATSDWILAFNWDEIFPVEEFKDLKHKLSLISNEIRYVECVRVYVLPKNFGWFGSRKRIIFKNRIGITFGFCNPEQGPKSNFRDFGRPIESNIWFDGESVIENTDNIVSRGDYLELLIKGETPRGYRNLNPENTLLTDIPYYNYNVAYFDNDSLIEHQKRSLKGYTGLPEDHRINVVAESKEEIVEEMMRKTKNNFFSIHTKKINHPFYGAEYLGRSGGNKNFIQEYFDRKYLYPLFITKIPLLTRGVGEITQYILKRWL